jgi:hypothetical protein
MNITAGEYYFIRPEEGGRRTEVAKTMNPIQSRSIPSKPSPVPPPSQDVRSRNPK